MLVAKDTGIDSNVLTAQVWGETGHFGVGEVETCNTRTAVVITIHLVAGKGFHVTPT